MYFSLVVALLKLRFQGNYQSRKIYIEKGNVREYVQVREDINISDDRLLLYS